MDADTTASNALYEFLEATLAAEQEGALNHTIDASLSAWRRWASGASKCRVPRPTGPETT